VKYTVCTSRSFSFLSRRKRCVSQWKVEHFDMPHWTRLGVKKFLRISSELLQLGCYFYTRVIGVHLIHSTISRPYVQLCKNVSFWEKVLLPWEKLFNFDNAFHSDFKHFIMTVEEWKTNLMSLAILFHFLCAQHVSDINISTCRSLRLCCWITTSVVMW